jgi:hypothetical protein
MAKIKYVVTGMNNQELGGLVGTLIQGELAGNAELVCCVGSPQAYKVVGAGQVVAIPFENLLSELVRTERRKLEESQAQKLQQQAQEEANRALEEIGIGLKPGKMLRMKRAD